MLMLATHHIQRSLKTPLRGRLSGQKEPERPFERASGRVLSEDPRGAGVGVAPAVVRD